MVTVRNWVFGLHKNIFRGFSTKVVCGAESGAVQNLLFVVVDIQRNDVINILAILFATNDTNAFNSRF